MTEPEQARIVGRVGLGAKGLVGQIVAVQSVPLGKILVGLCLHQVGRATILAEAVSIDVARSPATLSDIVLGTTFCESTERTAASRKLSIVRLDVDVTVVMSKEGLAAMGYYVDATEGEGVI